MQPEHDVVLIQEQALEQQEQPPVHPAAEEDELPDDATIECSQPYAHAANTVCTPADLLAAKVHFDTQMAKCKCDEACNFPGALQLAESFAKMSETERVSFVRAILFALTAPPDSAHDFVEWFPVSAQDRKRHRRSSNAAARSTTVYAIRGRRMCRSAFSAIVQLNARVINRHGATVSTMAPAIHTTGAGNNRKGSLSVQSRTVVLFLNRYSNLNALSCPTGRGSIDESPISWLTSDTTRRQVFLAYEKEWETIAESVVANASGQPQLPEAPLSKDQFCRVWAAQFPTLRIHKLGSDFCDSCTKMLNMFNTLTDPTAKTAIWQARNVHRAEALVEFQLYRQLQKDLNGVVDGTLHLTFDFAEKVLLPCLLRQPGQLHFVTGIKFDIFGVTSSTVNSTFVFGLPEGHWPGGKTANEVCSMIGFVIDEHRRDTVRPSQPLHLHADNCAGQNKNRYMLFYLAWRCMVGMDSNITLRFLVSGHTKNACDAAFGHVKRHLKRINVLNPRDMMRVIEGSAYSNKVVPSNSVSWTDWKEVLIPFFTIPKKFKISEYHVFNFEASSPGTVKVKRLSTTEHWESYRLLKNGLTAMSVLCDIRSSMMNGTNSLHAKALADVPSQQEGNRRAYLVKNICDRYYAQSDTFLDNYFGSGANWQETN